MVKWKTLDLMAYADFGLENSPSYKRDLLLKGINAYRKQIPEWMTKGKTTLIQKDLL